MGSAKENVSSLWTLSRYLYYTWNKYLCLNLINNKLLIYIIFPPLDDLNKSWHRIGKKSELAHVLEAPCDLDLACKTSRAVAMRLVTVHSSVAHSSHCAPQFHSAIHVLSADAVVRVISAKFSHLVTQSGILGVHECNSRLVVARNATSRVVVRVVSEQVHARGKNVRNARLHVQADVRGVRRADLDNKSL